MVEQSNARLETVENRPLLVLPSQDKRTYLTWDLTPTSARDLELGIDLSGFTSGGIASTELGFRKTDKILNAIDTGRNTAILSVDLADAATTQTGQPPKLSEAATQIAKKLASQTNTVRLDSLGLWGFFLPDGLLFAWPQTSAKSEQNPEAVQPKSWLLAFTAPLLSPDQFGTAVLGSWSRTAITVQKEGERPLQQDLLVFAQ